MDDDQQPPALTPPQDASQDASQDGALDAAQAAPDAMRNASMLEPATPAMPPAPPAPSTAPPRLPAASIRFLAPLPATTHLSESVVYRPGAAVALALLAGPAGCALAGALAGSLATGGAAPLGLSGGALPAWLPVAAPFALLLWLPALALAWARLVSVRVTPDTLACGRPLGRWRVLPFHAITRVERRGPRLRVYGPSGPPLSFSPRLLQRGAQLQRSLLLGLPLDALTPELRAEAQALNGAQGLHGPGALEGLEGLGDDDEDDLAEGQEGGVRGVLTARARRRWRALGGGAALLALAGAVVALVTLSPPVNLALGGALLALAAALGGLSLWTAQELFVSEQGLLITYPLLRVPREVRWAQVRLIEYLPGETALLLHRAPGLHETPGARGARGRSGARTEARTVVCAGPGLLDAAHAHRLRRAITRYCSAPVVALGPRSR